MYIEFYNHYCLEFHSRTWRDVLDQYLGGKVYQLIATCWWFIVVFGTNLTVRHDITNSSECDIAEILLKVEVIRDNYV